MCLNRLNAALDEWHSETGLKWRSIEMKRLTKIMTATMFACSIPTFAAAASFNCSKASTANEIAICSDDELSSLDETLAAVYKQARGSVSDAKRLKSEQINWIKSLGTCDGNAVCLISAYKTRMVVLDYLDGKIAVKVDPLQDRITQLNEREEILAQRENAFTTELRALDSELERFEEEKLAFANAKNAPLKVEEVSEEVPKTDNTSVKATEIKFNQELAEEFCSEKWTKRGVLDGEMFNYCFKLQTEGYGDALELYNKYSNVEPVELIDGVVAFALNKWTKRNNYQMDMVAYEIKQQGEAYLNYSYKLSNGGIDSQTVESCKSKWLKDAEPQWSMVEYCTDK